MTTGIGRCGAVGHGPVVSLFGVMLLRDGHGEVTLTGASGAATVAAVLREGGRREIEAAGGSWTMVVQHEPSATCTSRSIDVWTDPSGACPATVAIRGTDVSIGADVTQALTRLGRRPVVARAELSRFVAEGWPVMPRAPGDIRLIRSQPGRIVSSEPGLPQTARALRCSEGRGPVDEMLRLLDAWAGPVHLSMNGGPASLVLASAVARERGRRRLTASAAVPVDDGIGERRLVSTIAEHLGIALDVVDVDDDAFRAGAERSIREAVALPASPGQVLELIALPKAVGSPGLCISGTGEKERWLGDIYPSNSPVDAVSARRKRRALTAGRLSGMTMVLPLAQPKWRPPPGRSELLALSREFRVDEGLLRRTLDRAADCAQRVVGDDGAGSLSDEKLRDWRAWCRAVLLRSDSVDVVDL